MLDVILYTAKLVVRFMVWYDSAPQCCQRVATTRRPVLESDHVSEPEETTVTACLIDCRNRRLSSVDTTSSSFLYCY